MPLLHGDSQKTISHNISEMVHAHHPRNQAIAAALNEARRTRAEGGRVHKYHVGPIHSPVAGRTDHLPVHVVSGSYVLPADIISGMGEGNTMAGFKVAKDLFGQKFYGGYTSRTPYVSEGLPYGVTSPHRRSGGRADNHEHWDDRNLVPVVVAGGEFVMHPIDVVHRGHGSLDDGHAVMDQYVKRYRAHLIKTLGKLAGPRKD